MLISVLFLVRFDASNFVALNLVSADLRAPVATFWQQLDNALAAARRKALKLHRNTPEEQPDDLSDASESYFPIVLLSYCDLLEMSEALLFLQGCHRRDAVLVFAPHFIQGTLLAALHAPVF